jgi:hypothetical protein
MEAKEEDEENGKTEDKDAEKEQIKEEITEQRQWKNKMVSLYRLHVTPCYLVEVHLRFGGTYRLHLQV